MRPRAQHKNKRGAVRVEPRLESTSVVAVDLPPPMKAQTARFAIIAATVLLLAALGMVTLDYLARDGAFRIAHLSVQMEERFASRSEVLSAAWSAVDGNYFAVDLDAVAAAVAALPMVRAVEVRRQWPDALHLKAVEQPLLAYWNGGGVVNAHGEVFESPAWSSPPSLPTVNAPHNLLATAVQELHAWQQQLRAHGLQLTSLSLTERRAWSVTVRAAGQGAEVQLLLGSERMQERLARFTDGYENGLRAKFAQARRVDLRYPDGFAVQWLSNTTAEVSHAKKI